MSRIEAKFDELRAGGRKALIPFFTAGDPEPALTVPIMHALVRGGADIIELGVPFSDPMADGPTIQRSSERALKHGTSLRQILGFVAEFRAVDATTPVVLMGYANPIEAMGQRRLPTGARRSASTACSSWTIRLRNARHWSGSWTSAASIRSFYSRRPPWIARLDHVARLARGYLYYVSLKGVTGAGHLDLAELRRRIPHIRSHVSRARRRGLRHSRCCDSARGGRVLRRRRDRQPARGGNRAVETGRGARPRVGLYGRDQDRARCVSPAPAPRCGDTGG